MEHTAKDRTPFTYTIHCIDENVNYYGVRFARGCHPDELGVKYFSSSKTVKRLIKHYGVARFVFNVRKVFNSPEKAIAWETKVLCRLDAAHNPRWLNKHNNPGEASILRRITTRGWKWSELSKQKARKPKSSEHRKKLGTALAKNRFTWLGVKRADQSLRMLGNHLSKGKSRVVSEETREKLRIANSGKTFSYRPRNHPEKTCPRCGCTGSGPNMSRYHFNNCRIIP